MNEEGIREGDKSWAKTGRGEKFELDLFDRFEIDLLGGSNS